MKKPSHRQPFFIRLTQSGFTHNGFLFVVILILCTIFIFRFVHNRVSADSAKIESGISGYCLDDHLDSLASGAVVDAWKCNDTAAQDWVTTTTSIIHDSKYCLSVDGNSTTQGTEVVLNSCNSDPGQVWLRDQSGYENPNSGLCLSTSSGQPESQLYIDSCANLSQSQQSWIPITASGKSNSNPSCNGGEGQEVACYAAKEWNTWQSGSVSHETLLNMYTDGAPYEEWCADFVSYVYKEADYPFTQGEADGWDENIAANIQNMGFTEHSVSSGYIPQPGDVGFFDYAGGHVEIVVSGGKDPTFIYGDSATIDPTTGNGQMMANTITNDGSAGQVTYYLSPI